MSDQLARPVMREYEHPLIQLIVEVCMGLIVEVCMGPSQGFWVTQKQWYLFYEKERNKDLQVRGTW